MSLASKQREPEAATMLIFQCLFGLVGVLLTVAYFGYAKIKQNMTVNKWDRETKTIQDYSLLFRNLPFSYTEKKLTEHYRK